MKTFFLYSIVLFLSVLAALSITSPIDVAAETAKPCSALSQQYIFHETGQASMTKPKQVPPGMDPKKFFDQLSADYYAGQASAKKKCKDKMDKKQTEYYLKCVNYCSTQHACDSVYHSLADTECEPKGKTDPHLSPWTVIHDQGSNWVYNFLAEGTGSSSCTCKDKSTSGNSDQVQNSQDY